MLNLILAATWPAWVGVIAIGGGLFFTIIAIDAQLRG